MGSSFHTLREDVWSLSKEDVTHLSSQLCEVPPPTTDTYQAVRQLLSLAA